MQLRVCVDRPLSAAAQAAADDIAVEVRPDNLGVVPPTSATGPASVPGRQRLAVEKRYRWPVGQCLGVRFVDGHPALAERVLDAAREWTAHANVSFDVVDAGEADLRISFAQRGVSWSYVGTEAAVVARTEPTMNLGWLTPETPDAELGALVLHEFGHALGAIHEHPGPAIPWDRRAVIEYFGRTLGWSASQVEANVLARYRTGQTNLAAVDPHSVMRLAVPAELTGGAFATSWNTALSAGDRALMAELYPNRSPVVEVPVDGSATRAAVTGTGATGSFHFTVDRAGIHEMTAGPSELVLSLWGPHDEAILRAFDDNASRGDDARIVRRLDQGCYLLTVEHASGRAGRPCLVTVRRIPVAGAGHGPGGPVPPAD